MLEPTLLAPPAPDYVSNVEALVRDWRKVMEGTEPITDKLIMRSYVREYLEAQTQFTRVQCVQMIQRLRRGSVGTNYPKVKEKLPPKQREPARPSKKEVDLSPITEGL